MFIKKNPNNRLLEQFIQKGVTDNKVCWMYY